MEVGLTICTATASGAAAAIATVSTTENTGYFQLAQFVPKAGFVCKRV